MLGEGADEQQESSALATGRSERLDSTPVSVTGGSSTSERTGDPGITISAVASGEALDVSKVKMTSTAEPLLTQGVAHTDAFHVTWNGPVPFWLERLTGRGMPSTTKDAVRRPPSPSSSMTVTTTSMSSCGSTSGRRRTTSRAGTASTGRHPSTFTGHADQGGVRTCVEVVGHAVSVKIVQTSVLIAVGGPSIFVRTRVDGIVNTVVIPVVRAAVAVRIDRTPASSRHASTSSMMPSSSWSWGPVRPAERPSRRGRNRCGLHPRPSGRRLPGTTWRATTSTVIDETLSNALLSMRMPRRVSFDRSGEATVALNTDEPAKSTPEVAERPSSR